MATHSYSGVVGGSGVYPNVYQARDRNTPRTDQQSVFHMLSYLEAVSRGTLMCMPLDLGEKWKWSKKKLDADFTKNG